MGYLTEFKREKKGLSIDKVRNSCIFDFQWMNSDIDKLEFIDKIYGYGHKPSKEYQTSCKCGRDLETGYLFIIHQLREAGLLPDDYVPMCCFCNVLACIGFYIPDEWVNVEMYESSFQIENGIILMISAIWDPTGEPILVQVNIHNIELTLKTERIFNDVGVY